MAKGYQCEVKFMILNSIGISISHTYKWIKLEREHSIELENEQITFVWIDLPHIYC